MPLSHTSTEDMEKATDVGIKETEVQPANKAMMLWQKLDLFGVEKHSVAPVPVEERTDRRTLNIFTIWLTMSLTILPCIFGALGPLVYGLSLRDSALVILFGNLLTALIPAYMSTWGPKLGMRQTIASRYALGFFGSFVIVALNMATISGFVIIDAVSGGQALAAVNDTSVNVGIAVMSVLGLVLALGGYRWLHLFERWSSIPSFIAFLVAVGCGAKELAKQSSFPPATAPQVVGMLGLIAGYQVPWAAIAADFAVSIDPHESSWKLFLYMYAGLAVPSVALMALGAAIGGAVGSSEPITAGWENGGIGGAFGGLLEPAGGFGKFVLVLLAFSVLGNLASSLYAISLNLQMAIPFFAKVPRGVFPIIVVAVTLPVSIKAATSFFLSLESFVALIAYWSSSFSAIVITEHVVFRKSDFATYDLAKWNDWRSLPLGVPGVLAFCLSYGLMVPSMSVVWFTGPIGALTGDIGFELGFVLSVALYLVFRKVELKFFNGRF